MSSTAVGEKVNVKVMCFPNLSVTDFSFKRFVYTKVAKL